MQCQATDTLLAEITAQSRQLWQPPVYWVPVRHHSPACAAALRHLLDEVAPDQILIEGPSDCQDLVALCQDPATRPPVALLSQKGDIEALYSAYFPLCAYSPEWVALREGGARGIPVTFIDLPYARRQDPDPDERVESLMTERYLAHSRYLKTIAERLGCRDADEAWDRLFEQRPLTQLADWRRFFQEVAAYCALARRDYEPEVIDAAGDAAREAFMTERVRRALATARKGALVVVTGGFHTPALITGLAAGGETAAPPRSASDDVHRNWLVRYSFDQLDALNGYGAGMPSPAYYQAVWRAVGEGRSDYLQHSAVTLLIQIAHDNRHQQLARIISSAEVQAAAAHAENLARLRGCAGPGRSEVLDAVQSGYVKDALHRSLDLLADARRVLCGDRLGEIPATARHPPIVNDAWERGRGLGLDFTATRAKSLTLELHRRPAHRRLSRYLHTMAWIDSGLAQWEAGPDFVNGHQLGLMREQWRYAWTPQVESRLLAMVTEGATVEQVAADKLAAVESQMAQAGQGRQAGTAAALLIRACTMGLHRRVLPLAGTLDRLIDEDAHLPSVVDCGHRLTALQAGRTTLAVDRLALDPTALVDLCCRNALFLLPRLSGLKSADAEGMLPALVGLTALVKECDAHRSLMLAHMEKLRDAGDCAGCLRGGCLGLLLQAGRMDLDGVIGCLNTWLQPHQPVDLSVGGLKGLVRTARETLWRVPAVLERLNGLIAAWSEDHFLSMLPSLRLLFTELSPMEIDTVARRIARLNGLGDADALTGDPVALSPAELALIPQMEAFVKTGVTRMHLERWFFDRADLSGVEGGADDR